MPCKLVWNPGNEFCNAHRSGCILMDGLEPVLKVWGGQGGGDHMFDWACV